METREHSLRNIVFLAKRLRKQLWNEVESQVAIVADPAQRVAEPPPPTPVSNPAIFQVGDIVSFTDKYLREHVGTITRLNDKTVSLLCDGERSRVSRHFLRKIVDV